MNKWHKKYLLIIIVISIFFTLYKIFQTDIYKWFCDSENNFAACTVAGISLEKDGHFETAKIYYKKSCFQGYFLGCEKLLQIEKDKNERILINQKMCKIKPDSRNCQ